MKQAVNIVWFKRDLRLHDHAALTAAIKSKTPLILLFLFEPDLINAPDSAPRHWQFIHQSLQDLNRQLLIYNARIIYSYSNALPVFEELKSKFNINAVYSHQETHNQISFNRDKLMASWFRLNQISWHEFQTNGVIRKLKSRKDWPKLWEIYMRQPLVQPELNKLITADAGLPENLPDWINQKSKFLQAAGECEALKRLDIFLASDIANYAKHISKPGLSRRSCSRLSVYFTYGNLSVRKAMHQTAAAMPKNAALRFQYKFFITRLHWHCHFIQKFESMCSMEFKNVNPAFNAIRNEEKQALYAAWENGETGFPLVDASMKCLHKTGYINFRMRAMLISFLTHHLWQPWQRGALYLARLFLDYEPGIHYAQIQMQAGTMGVNTIRTYNPVKQSKDHDPDGEFIKEWLPQLKDLPVKYIHEPWLMTIEEQQQYQCILGKHYPYPIIDAIQAAKLASTQLWQVKANEETKQNNFAILNKLTSGGGGTFKRTKKNNTQRDLNFKLFE